MSGQTDPDGLIAEKVTPDALAADDLAVEGMLGSEVEAEAEAEGGAERRRVPLVALLPNLVTLLGLCAGLTAIRFGISGQHALAAALVVLAALMDGMDGLLARKLNAASHFGAELDSLSDFVCFGVAPGIFVWHFALSGVPAAGWLFALVYILCCCLRLARFNVSRDAPPPPGRAFFVGVPAPAGAMLALLPVFLTEAGWLDAREWPVPVMLYLGLVGLLMISRLPTLSPKALKIQRNNVPFALLGVAVLVGLMLLWPWGMMVAGCLAYLALLAQAAWGVRHRLARGWRRG